MSAGDVVFGEGSVRPQYDSYCLSNVTSTLLSVLGVENGRTKLPSDVLDGVDTTGIENVVLFVFDGLGYNEWQRQVGRGLFGRMAASGHTTPVTSVFPSTTAAALTSLTTALTPQEHSLIEWFLYLDELNTVIRTLPFSPLDEPGSDVLLSRADPSILVKAEPVFPRLTRQGIAAHSYLGWSISGGAYSRLMHRGSEMHPYTQADDLVSLLARNLGSHARRSFHYVYWSTIDSVEHEHGPGSHEAYAEAADVSLAMGKVVDKLERAATTRTLFAVTADHGHIRSPMKGALWLDAYPRLASRLSTGPGGRPIPPWGSPRDVYIRVKEDALESMHGYLADEMEGLVAVVKSSDAVASGLFGTGRPGPEFLRRVGNLMVLPGGKRSVWYHHPGVETAELVGQHGGLHPDEMTVPFSVARASKLARS